MVALHECYGPLVRAPACCLMTDTGSALQRLSLNAGGPARPGPVLPRAVEARDASGDRGAGLPPVREPGMLRSGPRPDKEAFPVVPRWCPRPVAFP